MGNNTTSPTPDMSLPLETPVLMIIFNRPEPTLQVLDAIRKVKPKRLFISADGPRSHKPEDGPNCANARAVAQQVDWDCEVLTNFLPDNNGCGEGPKKALEWFFSHVEEGIILEDDCIPDPTFFYYCQTLLEHYRFDTRVMHIGGVSHVPHAEHLFDGSYTFSSHSTIWGWASWRRAWSHYDYTMQHVPEVASTGWINHLFTSRLERWYRMRSYQRMQQAYLTGDPKAVTTWDYQLEFSRMIQNGLAIIPKTNMIQNVGFGEDATHTTDTEDIRNVFRAQAMDFPLAHPRFLVQNRRYDLRLFYRTVVLNWVFKKLGPLGKIFSR